MKNHKILFMVSTHVDKTILARFAPFLDEIVSTFGRQVTISNDDSGSIEQSTEFKISYFLLGDYDILITDDFFKLPPDSELKDEVIIFNKEMEDRRRNKLLIALGLVGKD